MPVSQLFRESHVVPMAVKVYITIPSVPNPNCVIQLRPVAYVVHLLLLLQAHECAYMVTEAYNRKHFELRFHSLPLFCPKFS
jgi:hypothetical protein